MIITILLCCVLQECNYPELVPCDLPYPETPDEQAGCVQGETGNTCDYGDLLIPSPDCCDYYRQCSNNIEYEMPCQVGADGERLWFDGQLGVGLHFIPQHQQLFPK